MLNLTVQVKKKIFSFPCSSWGNTEHENNAYEGEQILQGKLGGKGKMYVNEPDVNDYFLVNITQLAEDDFYGGRVL